MFTEPEQTLSLTSNNHSCMRLNPMKTSTAPKKHLGRYPKMEYGIATNKISQRTRNTPTNRVLVLETTAQKRNDTYG